MLVFTVTFNFFQAKALILGKKEVKERGEQGNYLRLFCFPTHRYVDQLILSTTNLINCTESERLSVASANNSAENTHMPSYPKTILN